MWSSEKDMRYIDPEKIVHQRFSEVASPTFDAAILIFRDDYASSLIRFYLEAKPYECRVLYGTSSSNTFLSSINNKKVLVVDHILWGATQTAILVEELAVLKVPIVIGVGACGSIDPTIPKGTLVIDSLAYITDGTSKSYTDDNAIPIHGFFKNIISNLKNGEKSVWGKSGTIDALYRETEELIQAFKDKGIQIINMESSALYSVSRALGLKCCWLGIVSDVLGNEGWDDWFETKAATEKSGKFARALIEETLK